MKHVFISYTKEDERVAEAICHVLESKLIRCWFAPRNIQVGNYPEQIAQAIRDSQLVVCVYSKHVRNSRSVAQELAKFYDNKVLIVPFRIDDAPYADNVEFFLQTLQFVQADTEALQASIVELALFIQPHIEMLKGIERIENADSPAPKSYPRLPLWRGVLAVVLLLLSGVFFWHGPPTHLLSRELCNNHLQRQLDVLQKNAAQHVDAINRISCQLPNRDIELRLWVTPDKQDYQLGDTVAFQGMLSQSAYIAAYMHQPDGSSVLIYPNYLASSVFRKPADKRFWIGGENPAGEGNFQLKLVPPKGIDVLHVIATDDKATYQQLLAQLHPGGRYQVNSEVIADTMRGIAVVNAKAEATDNSLGQTESVAVTPKTRWGEALVAIQTR